MLFTGAVFGYLALRDAWRGGGVPASVACEDLPPVAEVNAALEQHARLTQGEAIKRLLDEEPCGVPIELKNA